jgi:DNA-binding XRE family transcriptional regulator
MNVALITARKNAGLSQREAAQQIGVSQDILQRAERGESHPHLQHAKLIADFYNVKVTDFWPVRERAMR